MSSAFERPVAPATRRHLEHAGFVATVVGHGSNVQALQLSMLRDALSQLLDRDAIFHLANVRLSTSLLKGISREGDMVIFWTAFIISSRKHLCGLLVWRVAASTANRITAAPSRQWKAPPRSAGPHNPRCGLRSSKTAAAI